MIWGREHDERDDGHHGMQEDHVAQDRDEDFGLKDGLGDAAADEAADGLRLGEDHQHADALRIVRLVFGGTPIEGSMDAASQRANGVFRDPGTIHVHDELHQALAECDAGVGDREHQDRSIRVTLERVVHEAALDLQRRGAEQKHGDRYGEQPELMPPACLSNEPEQRRRHALPEQRLAMHGGGGHVDGIGGRLRHARIVGCDGRREVRHATDFGTGRSKIVAGISPPGSEIVRLLHGERCREARMCAALDRRLAQRTMPGVVPGGPLARELDVVRWGDVLVHDGPDDQERHGEEGADGTPEPGPKHDTEKDQERIYREPTPDDGGRQEVAFDGGQRDEHAGGQQTHQQRRVASSCPRRAARWSPSPVRHRGCS